MILSVSRFPAVNTAFLSVIITQKAAQRIPHMIKEDMQSGSHGLHAPCSRQWDTETMSHDRIHLQESIISETKKQTHQHCIHHSAERCRKISSMMLSHRCSDVRFHQSGKDRHSASKNISRHIPADVFCSQQFQVSKETEIPHHCLQTEKYCR